MTNLRADLILQRVSGFEIVVSSGTELEVVTGGLRLRVNNNIFPILETFAYPTSVSNALDALRPHLSGVQNWIDITATIARLHDAGILVDETQKGLAMNLESKGFDSALVHTVMLNDRARTSAFISGIEKLVKPGDIVVDVGTGTGILALTAARAGARHVYAIEATSIGQTAEILFDSNGFGDRITLLRGWSTQLNVPELADVLISEIIGNEPLGERVLETTIDARKRLLKPNATMIPGALKIWGLPISIPADELNKRSFTKGSVKNWSTWYGFDFTSLLKSSDNFSQSFFIRSQKASEWRRLCDPILLADIDFQTIKQNSIDRTVQAHSLQRGELNGLLVYFDLEIGPGTVLSTHPDFADQANHWNSLVWLLTNPLEIRANDALTISYKYRVAGSKDGVEISKS